MPKMCYFIDNSKLGIGDDRDEQIKRNIKAYINGLDHPNVPIITDESSEVILGKWRFNPNIPENSKTITIGLNIQSEEATKTPMFKDFTDQHCIVPVNGFYEWKHYNSSKIRVKHYITMQNEETFYLAGLWRFYNDKKVSFGILTTPSNELMTDIHNNKKRMPICLNKKQADLFLKSDKLDSIIFPNLDPQLSAFNLEPEKLIGLQGNLFE